jgi:hypothetical protein
LIPGGGPSDLLGDKDMLQISSIHIYTYIYFLNYDSSQGKVPSRFLGNKDMLELNLIEFNLHQFIIYLRGRTPATSSARRTCIYFIYLFIYIYDCSLAKDP